MSKTLKLPETIYAKRIRKLQSLLKKEPYQSALFVSSASAAIRSRDTNHPFRQDSNFFYLSGSAIRDCVLFISAEQVQLVSKKLDPVELLWEGSSGNPKQLAERLSIDSIQSDDMLGTLKSLIRGVEQVYFDNRAGSVSEALTQFLIASQAGYRTSVPNRLIHCDVLLERLRLYKQPQEIALTKEAISLSHAALQKIAPLIRSGVSELEISRKIQAFFLENDAFLGFETIAATGKNAATLHYHNLSSKLRKSDLFLLDFGAEKNMYSADITRVFPVSGKFLSWQLELYNIVLAAEEAAIRKVKPGVPIKRVYQAAAKELVIGLKQLGVLRGNVTDLLKKGSHRKYFPHGIGHSLGLDVHDIGTLRGSSNSMLEKGMLLTIEPGLYFAKKTKGIPPCGIRIEDDILVTKNGSVNLSSAIPKEATAVETLMQ